MMNCNVNTYIKFLRSKRTVFTFAICTFIFCFCQILQAYTVLDNLARRSQEVKVTASDFGTGTSWASSVCDDDGTATVWKSASTTGSKWLELEWPYPHNIDYVELQETSDASGTYLIKSYDPSTAVWTTLFSGSLSTATTYGGAVSSCLSKKVRIEFNLTSATSLAVPVVNIYTATEGLPCADSTTYLTTGMYKHDNLTYHSSDVIEIVGVSYNTSAAPGGWLNGTVTLKTGSAINSDYCIAMEVNSPIYAVLPLRWQILSWRYEDPRTAAKLIWPSPATSNWSPNTNYTIPFSIFLGNSSPDGNNTISLFFYNSSFQMPKIKQNGSTWYGTTGTGTRDVDRQYAIGTVDISRHTPYTPGSISIAVEANGDAPCLKINGNRVPPVINVADYADYEILDDYQSTQLSSPQINLYRVGALGYTVTSDSYQASLNASNVDQIQRKIAQVLRIDPHAYFIVTLVLRVEDAWLTENPDERAVDGNGVTCQYNSFHSNVWKQDSIAAISSIVSALESGSCRDRIAGYALFAGEGGEFRPSSGLLSGYVERDYAKLGDFGSAAVTSFTDWLKIKYNNDIAVLRNAWNNSTMTWDNVMPSKSQLIAAPAALGWFFSPGGTEQQVIDYFLWTADDISGDVIAFCKAIKDTTETGALAGAYYGYKHTANQVPGTFQAIGHAYLHKAVDSAYVDFISLPYSYCSRTSDRPYSDYSITGSLMARNKLFFNELDQRTFAVHPSVYSQSSEYLSMQIMRRDFGHNLCIGSGFWWKPFDQGRVSTLATNNESVRWYKHPDLLDTMYDARSLYQTQYSRGFSKASEIAVIVDYDSTLYTDIYASIPHYNSTIRMLEEEIPKIGAPYDIYSMDDLGLDYVKNNYKMYIFVNTHYVDAVKANIIVNNYQKDGKTLVWMWAPGYLHETGPSVYNMQLLTGLDFGGVSGSQWLNDPVRISTTSSSITTGFSGTYKLNNWHTNSYAINLYANKIKLNPVFWVTTSNCIVGGYWDAPGHASDGQNALVFKDLGTWKTAFSAIPYIPHVILRNIAELAGVHVYCETTGITYQGNEDFAVIYNTNSYTASPITITLPSARKIYNATGSVLFGGVPQTTFNIGLLAGGTAILRYDVP